MKIIRRILAFLFGQTIYVMTVDGYLVTIKRVRKIAVHMERLYVWSPGSIPKPQIIRERARTLFQGLWGINGWVWTDEIAAYGTEPPTSHP